MFCNFHPSTPISLICLAQHKCQRKFCVECQFEHKADRIHSPYKQISRIGDQKFQEFKLDGNSELTQLKKSLKQIQSQTEIQIKNVTQMMGKIRQMERNNFKLLEVSQQFLVNSKAQAYEFGEYKYDQIKGTWKQFYKEQQVYENINTLAVRGEYNDFGEKSGIWREFWPGFWEKSFAIYNGEYKKAKVGKWEILLKMGLIAKIKMQSQKDYQQLLQEVDNMIQEIQKLRLGNGLNLERVLEKSQITYCGEYEKRKKLGNGIIFISKKLCKYKCYIINLVVVENMIMEVG